VSYRLDAVLLMTWLLILGLGTVMVASAGVVKGDSFLPKHGLFLCVAMAGFVGCLLTPLAWWERFSRLAWLAAVALCVLVLLVGSETNGAVRWIRVGGFSLQAAEASKLLMLVYFAGYLARFHGRFADEPLVMVRLFGMYGVLAALLLLEPDFGSVVVLAASLIGLLFLAGVRLRHFLLVVIAGVSLFALLAIVEPYRFARLVAFLDPWAQAMDSGYQLTQALIAFGRGELFGLGLGEGVQKLHYLPEAHNDFIFAVIAEELGLLGALVVIGLFALLVMRLLRIARQALDAGHLFGGYLVYGVALLIGLQCLVNMGVNTGVLPTKGLTLPFVSYGGNSLIVCSMLLGLSFRTELETSGG